MRDLYKPFNSIYNVWVDVQLVLYTKVNRLLAVESLAYGTVNEVELAASWNKHHAYNDPGDILRAELSTPIPLNQICSACYYTDPPPEFAVVSFDGCMQQKRLIISATKDPKDGSRYRSLFVDNGNYDAVCPIYRTRSSNGLEPRERDGRNNMQ
jgi:hypothetical protein